MSQLNSMPRPSLMGLSPPLAMLGAALGIREVPCGELDLTPRAFDRARAERGCRLFARGPRPTTG